MAQKKLICTILSSLLTASCLFTACGLNQTADAGSAAGFANEEPSSPAAGTVPTASLTIHTGPSAGENSHSVSDTLYGIFLEDINFALDGGLYAEMVKNRSFEYGAAAGNRDKHGWICTDPSADAFSFTVADGSENGTSLNENNPRYAVLVNETDRTLGIFNKGFLEGLSVQEGADYLFTAYFKSDSGCSGPVSVSLRDAEDEIYAAGKIDSISGEWQKYSLTLTPSRSSASGKETRLYVELEQGSLCADMISLMPADTYKGTSVRKDIGEYLEALNPSFLRFPGGCVIEGRDEESIYSWKDSIGNGLSFTVNGETVTGDIAARTQGKSIWNGTAGHPYYTTYGIGFYEFFELCEILDCMPVPVLNAGMTCQVQSPKYIVYDIDSEEFAQAVQDALDLVEFCRGDETTYWGSIRTAMGHSEPFSLKYIGIGNEQWQTEYFRHYKKFVEAFEEAATKNPDLYGDIELIVANGPSSGDKNGWNYVEDNEADTLTALVDEHYYEAPNWFLTNTTRYDKYDRDLSATVFLGEYAAQSNTLEAALAEAAYMTGLERNSDIITMACYAPLFGNSTSNQWTPDLIWYSQSDVYGSVNYYVQKLFGNNVGTSILPSELDTSGLSTETALSGKIGLGTWQTSAAYDNLVVTSNDTGEILYECSFDTVAVLKDDGWEENEGEWSVTDGRLVQSYTGAPYDTNTGDAAYVGETSWQNYTLTVDAEILNGSEGFLIPVCVQNTANNIFWNIGGWGNTISCLQSVSGNTKSGQLTGTVKNMTLKHNQVYKLKVVVSGSNIQCFVNDMKYVDYTYESSEALYETASVDENGDIIIKLVNVSEIPVDVTVFLKDFDAAAYESTAAVTVLKGENLSDVNSFEEPEKMAPEDMTAEIGSEFVYAAPKYSVSVIRIKKN